MTLRLLAGAFLMLMLSLLATAGLRAQTPQSSRARAAGVFHPSLPTPVLPDGLGVNIHFTDPRPGEMKMLAEGGFRWIRMDFTWSATERERGRYDFAAYDRLMAALDEHRIKPLFILDYGNALYAPDIPDHPATPRTEAARQAMARWAAAAVTHFKGRGIVWEMWNEPNISGFWKPAPNSDEYIRLARVVGRAVRAAAPREAFIGPATSTIDLPFLEACFKAGLLQLWDAVSVHPYRQNNPETASDEYRRLRLLISKYAPTGKQIPILSGEWGYSSVWNGFTEERQGKMLPRQWMINLLNDVPLSIWYDWHDDGPDPKEAEHHFGTTLHPYNEGRDPVYEPKPAYRAAQALAQTLGGYRFNKRLALQNPEDYLMLFSRPNENSSDVILAAWTTAPKPRRALIPASAGRFSARGHLGQNLAPLVAGANGLSVLLTDAPQYLTPQSPNELLSLAASWQRAPLEITARGPARVTVPLRLVNPLARPLNVLAGESIGRVPLRPGGKNSIVTMAWVTRDMEPRTVRLELDVKGMSRVAQETQIIVTNPLRVTVLPLTRDGLPVRIENPSGEAFRGTLEVVGGATGTASGTPANATPLQLQRGQTEATVRLPMPQSAQRSDYNIGLQLRDAASGNVVVLKVPAARFRLVDDFARHANSTLPGAYTVIGDGDAKVASEQSITVATPPDNAGGNVGAGALRLDYRFDAGWKFARVLPQTPALQKIEGRPEALGMWIYGDGSGHWARLRFVDATGQTLQPNGPKIDWKGWRYVTFPLDGSSAGFWGGANDGQIHGAIRWDSLFLLDSADRQPTRGTIYLSSPTLIY